MNNPRSIAQLFDGFSNVYDSTLILFTLGLDSIWKRRLLNKLGEMRGCTVLDVATGTGLLAIRLARMVGRDGHVVGVDLSRSMVARAKTKLSASNVHLAASMAEHLPFADHIFDKISACYLQKYCSQEKFLSEVKRLLKPDGIAVLYDFCEPTGKRGVVPRLYMSGILKLLATLVRPVHAGLSRLLCFLPGKISSSRWHDRIGSDASKSALRVLSVERLPSGAAILVALAAL